ncbi:MAG: hypothetical protein H0X39_00450 [Actinobacteria bacterium]|nr:hypothetical protein [Actinomycetota bacterium]
MRLYPTDAAGNPMPGAWDVVYGGTDSTGANGAFAPRYATSSRVGNTWTVRPPGGTWPCPVRVWCDEAGAGLTPALQAVDSSTVAAWSLLQDAADTATPVAVYNRATTGSSYDLSQPNNTCMPSLIPGQIAYAAALVGGSGGYGGGIGGNVTTPVLGAWSMTAMVFLNPTQVGSLDRWLYAHGDYDQGTGQTTASFLMGASGGNCPTYYHDAAGSAQVLFFTALSLPVDGQWHFVGVSRASNGLDVTVYVDTASQTLSATAAPSGGAGGCENLQGHRGSPRCLQGGAYDVMIFNVALTSAQMTARRKVMMGLP